MTKLVVLKFGKGTFEAGFPVTLQIGEENSRAETEVIGELPPDKELVLDFNNWQAIYRNLDFSARSKGLPKVQKVISSDVECLQAAEKLRHHLNQWLQSETFRNIREKWLEKLQKYDQIRVIVQTEDDQLQKLPWHLWEIIERYPNAEIGLATIAELRLTNVDDSQLAKDWENLLQVVKLEKLVTKALITTTEKSTSNESKI